MVLFAPLVYGKGDYMEKIETDTLFLRIPKDLKRKIKYRAGCNKRSMNQEINMVLETTTLGLEVPEDFK